MTDPIRLRTLLGDTPRNKALRTGEVSSPFVTFDFAKVTPVTDGFPDMVRNDVYDFGELAIITFMQAKLEQKPLVLLPAVVVALPQHVALMFNADRGPMRVEDLPGKRVGVRSFTQTTGVWVRGIMADYGVNFADLDWVVFQEPHVQGYRPPDFVRRAPAGKTMLQMLLDGELDAAVGIGAAAAEHPQLQPLIPEPLAAADDWARRKGFTPINHMAVVTRKLNDERPDVVRELYRLLDESKRAAPPAPIGGHDPMPSGIEANRPALEQAIEFAFSQGVITRRLTVDELFEDARRTLDL
jgi:4,5-dihydroxyphthalate decarboxylase